MRDPRTTPARPPTAINRARLTATPPTDAPIVRLVQAPQKNAARGCRRLPEPRLPARPDQARNIAALELLCTCATTSRSQEPPRGADRNRLPSAPVLDAVRRLARLRHESLRGLLGAELFIAYCNAHATGTINLITLERLCDEILGWHPRMLYADAYDERLFRPPDLP